MCGSRLFLKVMKTAEIIRFPLFYGANDVTRTHDLLITNQLLYRLSYSSVFSFIAAPSGSYESAALPTELHQHTYLVRLSSFALMLPYQQSKTFSLRVRCSAIEPHQQIGPREQPSRRQRVQYSIFGAVRQGAFRRHFANSRRKPARRRLSPLKIVEIHGRKLTSRKNCAIVNLYVHRHRIPSAEEGTYATESKWKEETLCIGS